MKNKPLPELEEQWKEEAKQIGFDDLLWKVEDEEDGKDDECVYYKKPVGRT